MVDIHIRVRDEKYGFLMDLLRYFDFVKIEDSGKATELSIEEQREINRRYDEIVSGNAKFISKEKLDKLLR